jgi:hypothetical protein
VTLPRPPRWALATLETHTGPLATLILEAATAGSYTAIRTQLTMTGCIGQIDPHDWQQRRWPNSGRLHLHHTDRRVTTLTSPGPTIQMPGGLDASQEWIDAASTGYTLLAVIPPGTTTTRPQPSDADPIEFLLADLAHSHRLTAGLAITTSDPGRT